MPKPTADWKIAPVWEYTYNERNQLTAVKQPVWKAADTVTTGKVVTTSYAYDPYGRLQKMTDGNNKVTEYTYTKFSQVEQVREPYKDDKGIDKPVKFSYTYDASGNQLTVQDRKGQTTSYTYDKTARNTADGGTAYTTTVTDNFGQTSITTEYLAAGGQKVTKTVPDLTQAGKTKTITYVYNNLGQLVETTDYSGQKLTHTYDTLGRLDKVFEGSLVQAYLQCTEPINQHPKQRRNSIPSHIQL